MTSVAAVLECSSRLGLDPSLGAAPIALWLRSGVAHADPHCRPGSGSAEPGTVLLSEVPELCPGCEWALGPELPVWAAAAALYRVEELSGLTLPGASDFHVLGLSLRTLAPLHLPPTAAALRTAGTALLASWRADRPLLASMALQRCATELVAGGKRSAPRPRPYLGALLSELYDRPFEFSTDLSRLCASWRAARTSGLPRALPLLQVSALPGAADAVAEVYAMLDAELAVVVADSSRRMVGVRSRPFEGFQGADWPLELVSAAFFLNASPLLLDVPTPVASWLSERIHCEVTELSLELSPQVLETALQLWVDSPEGPLSSLPAALDAARLL